MLKRVALVLETRPGTIPWRPKFGCDLASLVGVPATEDLVREARDRVIAAVKEWVPQVKIVSCEVGVVPIAGRGATAARTTPVAESALLGLGVDAALELDLELQGPDGRLNMTASVVP